MTDGLCRGIQIFSDNNCSLLYDEKDYFRLPENKEKEIVSLTTDDMYEVALKGECYFCEVFVGYQSCNSSVYYFRFTSLFNYKPVHYTYHISVVNQCSSSSDCQNGGTCETSLFTTRCNCVGTNHRGSHSDEGEYFGLKSRVVGMGKIYSVFFLKEHKIQQKY